MIKNLDVANLKDKDVDIEILKSRLSTGSSIMFTGAGFSCGTQNVLDEEPPMAGALAKKLSVLANIDESDDLMFASDVALEYFNHKDILNLLKDNYTLKKVSNYHEAICNVPWKKFYTTNYDNSIELASLNVGKRITPVDTSGNPADYINQPNLCLHINGKVEGALPADLKSRIKLSDASYLSPSSFLSSQWNYHFKRDLETASAIVFIGYSMYDIDVKKILFEGKKAIGVEFIYKKKIYKVSLVSVS